jgi:hypothetical protein
MILAALTVNGCAATPPETFLAPREAAVERVTAEMWAEAQAQAARLSGDQLSLSDARPAKIVHLPIAELCELLGRCPHAAAYDPVNRVAYLRNDRPWVSDRGHNFGIVIHEAAHSMQPDTMSPACREAGAHAVQMAWLEEQGLDSSGVAESASRFVCETTLADAMPW